MTYDEHNRARYLPNFGQIVFELGQSEIYQNFQVSGKMSVSKIEIRILENYGGVSSDLCGLQILGRFL